MLLDINFSEILVILIVAIVVLGPQRLPIAARKAGECLHKLRMYSQKLKDGFDLLEKQLELERNKARAESVKNKTETT